LLEYAAHLGLRKDVGNELRLKALRKPLSSRHEPGRIIAAAMKAKLANDAQIGGHADRFALLALSQPTLDQVTQIGYSISGAMRSGHMSVEVPQRAFRPLIAETQGTFVVQECPQLRF
jgi:hypothetical protein